MEWISTKEKYPPNNERVLIFYDDGVIRIGMAECNELDCVTSKKKMFTRPTHWMPLPEPPKD